MEKDDRDKHVNTEEQRGPNRQQLRLIFWCVLFVFAIAVAQILGFIFI